MDQIAELKTCETTCNVQNISEARVINRTSDVTLSQKCNDSLMNLSNRLSVLEADKANISDRIAELEMIGLSDSSISKTHNETLISLVIHVSKLESDLSVIETITDKIYGIAENQNKQNNALIDHEERIVEL